MEPPERTNNEMGILRFVQSGEILFGMRNGEVIIILSLISPGVIGVTLMN
jgi:hypothetical protein